MWLCIIEEETLNHIDKYELILNDISNPEDFQSMSSNYRYDYLRLVSGGHKNETLKINKGCVITSPITPHITS